jgi:hypothetical protein
MNKPIIVIIAIILILYLLSRNKTVENFVGGGALMQLYAKDSQDTYLNVGINRYLYPTRLSRRGWYNNYLFDTIYVYPYRIPLLNYFY